MRKEENKLFKFATKELSQDAFISWCINWFNFKDSVKGNKNKEKLTQLSENILEKILINTNVKVKDIKEVSIIRQYIGIDILLIITTKKLEEYFVIIEDKVQSKLSKGQVKDFYISKLIKKLDNNINNQKLLEINEFKKENIIPVFWNTKGFKENIDEVQKNVRKIIGKELIYINGNDTIEFLKNYIDCSEIVEDFYICLQEYLRANNKIIDDKYSVEAIIKNNKIQEGTTFSKNYNAYNCFSNLLNKKYTAHNHSQIGGIILKDLSSRILKEEVLNKDSKLPNTSKNGKNIIAVNTIKFYTFNGDYQNYMTENNGEWHEITPPNKLYTNLRYIFLFGQRFNTFREKRYEFFGLYKLTEYDKKNNIRKWKKCSVENNEIPLEENKIIELIKQYEKSDK